jgi:cytochrome b561
MSAGSYGKTAIALHWLQAVLVLSLLVMGFFMVDLPKGPDKSWVYALHKSLGQCALLLLLLRASWRWRHPPPPPLESTGWRAQLAHGTHRLLYALLLLAPVAGYLSASFTKYPMKFFGVVTPKIGWPSEMLNEIFNSLHKGAVLALALLIGLHLAAVLYHVLRRDGTLERMLPFSKPLSGNQVAK